MAENLIEPDNKSGSGDTSFKVAEKPPEPELPKIPDVELIVDGFGFMPKHEHGYRGERRRSSAFRATKLGPKQEHKFDNMAEEQEQSSCASSTNVDIVRRYTWKTKNRMIVQVITYGATLTNITVPDKKGVPDDVLAGFDTLEEYFQVRNPYFGATIGRNANMIRDATMVIRPSGRMYMLSSNKGPHHYHGGHIGFDKVNWRSHVHGLKVIMSHVSERFHEGYPGTVMAQVSFEVTCDNTIKIEMKCTTSEPTVINLSNSPYFNLAGHHAGTEAMVDHVFTINADKYTAVDVDGYVTGERKVVGGTPYDFRVPRLLKVMLPKIPMGGYDINFCTTRGTAQDLTFQARVLHPLTGRVLEVYSNQPGMQFYTGNLLPDPDQIVEEMGMDEEVVEEQKAKDEKSEAAEDADMGSEDSSRSSAKDEAAEEEEREGKKRVGYVPLLGKHGTVYKRHGLFCLMPQNYPDAVNNKNFPTPVIYPGQQYVHKIQYKFGILIGKYV